MDTVLEIDGLALHSGEGRGLQLAARRWETV
jgi:hypothetical protein